MALTIGPGWTIGGGWVFTPDPPAVPTAIDYLLVAGGGAGGSVSGYEGGGGGLAT